jgi:hypothetical protein
MYTHNSLFREPWSDTPVMLSPYLSAYFGQDPQSDIDFHQFSLILIFTSSHDSHLRQPSCKPLRDHTTFALVTPRASRTKYTTPA